MKDKIRDQQAVYYITFATVQWVDVFSRYCYAEAFIDSLKYCIRSKELNVHAWCLMTNHVHLIISTAKDNLSDIIRDMKKFTSGTIIRMIEQNSEESRRGWMLWLFSEAGKNNSKNETYQFWQQDNRPILLETQQFTLTKLNYIHNNPVKSGIVEKAEDYLLSSAKDYSGGKGLIEIQHLDAAYSLGRF